MQQDATESWVPPAIPIAVDLVILTLRESRFDVLLVERGIEPFKGGQALPGGFLSSAGEDIYDAALRELHEEAGLDGSALHIEQVGAYGAPDRDPRGRVLSVAYLAIAPGLPEPVAGTDASAAAWTAVDDVLSGHVKLAFDHLAIVEDAVERARAKLEHTPLATAFCGKRFTIADLQRVYEAVWGADLDLRNFYRKVQRVEGFIESTGTERREAKGRPARLFRAGSATALHPPLTRPDRTPRAEEHQ
ncbi:NUDIX domain-containing protein [Glycomyces sp. NRRL B-16210]|uniref:NUDIX hydrolase n=1 Tax=Glycomyces sp. NRRL B-16210 TaxID=1463821 RepID=UPI000A98DE74|nr:NUDIX domain-containing protein [Glycomyces sp. NRRL B-16210]